MCAKTNTEDFPRLYNPFDTVSADTLHRLGQKLSDTVSPSPLNHDRQSVSRRRRLDTGADIEIFSLKIGSCSARTKILEASSTKPRSRARTVCTRFDCEDRVLTVALAQEIATLRKEAQAFKKVRTALRSPNTENNDAAKMVFEKVKGYPFLFWPDPLTLAQVFFSDINNLLSMADMWRSRAKPTPLDFDGIKNGTFTLDQRQPNGAHTNGSSNGAASNGSNGSGSAATEKLLGAQASNTASTSAAGLKDQRSLTLQDNLELFVERYA